jgi:hypothetical protein
MVTMSQKSSVPQAVKSVSQALMSDNHGHGKRRHVASLFLIRPGETRNGLRAVKGIGHVV